jgi:hypothetical protein
VVQVELLLFEISQVQNRQGLPMGLATPMTRTMNCSHKTSLPEENEGINPSLEIYFFVLTLS